jgi:hypothetical protein
MKNAERIDVAPTLDFFMFQRPITNASTRSPKKTALRKMRRTRQGQPQVMIVVEQKKVEWIQ